MMPSAIESVSPNDRTALAAVALATTNGNTDWDEATRIAGSKSVHAMKERVRMARKRFEEQNTVSNGSESPASGVNKKAINKITPSTPKKATQSKKKASPLKVKPEKQEESEDEC